MSLRRRLALSLTALVLLTSVCAGAGLYFLRQVNHNVERMYTQEVVALEALDDVKSALYRIRGDALEHILARSPGDETRLAGEIAEQERRARERVQLYRTTRLSADEEALLVTFVRHFDTYTSRVREDILPVSAAGDKRLAEIMVADDAVEEFRAAREAMNDLMDYALRRAQERSAEARELYQASVAALVVVAAAIAVLGRAIASRLSRSILDPLLALIAHFRRIERGDLTQPVPSGRADEIGEVMVALGNTQRRLRETDAERRSALDSLRENEQRFRTAFANAPVGMAIVTLDGRWEEVNATLCGMLGRTATELLADGSSAVTHPDDRHIERQLFRDALGAAALDEGKSGGIRDTRYLHRDGHVVVAEIDAAVVLGSADRPTHCLLQAVDVTGARSSRAELELMARQDSLTGFANRSVFLQLLHGALATGPGEGLLAVLFIDLDRFKFVNDVLGHRAGDQLLVLMSRRIERCLRQSDTVARFGGDEFVVLLEHMRDPVEAVHVAERVLAAVREPVVLSGHQVVCSASVGIACTSPGTERPAPDDLLHDADMAMYEAKTAGKNQYRMAGPEQRARSRARLALEADLRLALQEDQLRVHYQPIMDLHSCQVRGMEALVRWEHPVHGLLGPADFLPMAEDTGLIVPLGRWVLERACAAGRRWDQEAALPEGFVIHVNLSAKQLRAELLDELDAVLATTGLPPERLCLELTETLLAHDDGETARLMDEVGRRGVRLAIDDFGAEYSSLGRLKRLPLTCLKIDKAFVENLTADARDSAIIRAVIEMASSLSLEVVAEGIETPEQALALADLGCTLGQGYLLGRPVPEDAAATLLSLRGDVLELARLNSTVPIA